MEAERQLPALLVQISERAGAVLRGKALLAAALLLRASPRSLIPSVAARLPALADRAAKEKEPYMSRCLAILQAAVTELAPRIATTAADEVEAAAAAHAQRLKQGGGSSGGGGSGAGGAPPSATEKQQLLQQQARVASAIAMLQVLPDLVGSHSLRGVWLSPRLLEDVARLLEAAESLPEVAPVGDVGGPVGGPATDGTSATGLAADPREVVLQVVESLSQVAPALTKSDPAAVVGGLLPVLSDVLASSTNADARFLCLKLVCDMLLPLLPEAYGEGAEAGGAASAELARQLDALLQQRLLPACQRLLSDEDPIPLFALKLLGGAMEANARLAETAVAAGLAPPLFSFLSLEHPNNNVHNVRACAALAACPALRDAALGELNASAKSAAVLAYAFENSVEPFLEPTLGICAALLTRRRDGRGSGGAALRAEALLAASPVLVELVSSVEPNLAETAAECLALLLECFPEKASAELLSGQGAAQLAVALGRIGDAAGSVGAQPLQQAHVGAVRAVATALEVQISLAGAAEAAPAGALAQLGAPLERLRKAPGDGRLASAAAAALAALTMLDDL